MKRLPLAAVLLASLFATEAHTSERQRKVTLEQVVERAELIVLARPADPPAVQKERTISADAKAEAERPIKAGSEVPPFRYAIQRWIVDEVVFSSRDATAARDEVLEIEPADLDYDFGIYVKRHLHGVNKIALREVYEPGSKPGRKAGDARLLFLVRVGDRLRFAYRGAVESPARRAEVSKLARKAQRPGDVQLIESPVD